MEGTVHLPANHQNLATLPVAVQSAAERSVSVVSSRREAPAPRSAATVARCHTVAAERNPGPRPAAKRDLSPCQPTPRRNSASAKPHQTRPAGATAPVRAGKRNHAESLGATPVARTREPLVITRISERAAPNGGVPAIGGSSGLTAPGCAALTSPVKRDAGACQLARPSVSRGVR